MTDEDTCVFTLDGDELVAVLGVGHGNGSVQLHVGKQRPDEGQRDLVGLFDIGYTNLCGSGTESEQTLLRFLENFIGNGRCVDTEVCRTLCDSGFDGFCRFNDFLFHFGLLP